MACKTPQIFPAISKTVPMPCGGCLPCRIYQTKIMTLRMILETKQHDFSSFLTTTYEDNYLPPSFSHPKTGEIYAPNSVQPLDHELFLHRLRKSWKKATNQTFRFHAVGEYGGQFGRPHYHYALFGIPPCPLRSRQSPEQRRNCKCSLCSLVRTSWRQGNIQMDELNETTTRYICGYIQKKLTRNVSSAQKRFLQDRHPEFTRSSMRPGLGSAAARLMAEQLKPQIHHWSEIPRSIKIGSKTWPLGKYLFDQIRANLGYTLKEGEALAYYEETLRTMLYPDEKSKETARKAQVCLAKALGKLNAQKNVNILAKTKLYTHDYYRDQPHYEQEKTNATLDFKSFEYKTPYL